MSVSLQDIVKGLDPTGYTSISGSELAQMVDVCSPADDRGLTIWTEDSGATPDVPNPELSSGYNKLKRYLWIRQMATTTKVYAWNDTAASDATYLKWIDLTNLSIATGSVTNSMLAGGITNDKLVSIEYSKVSGAPTSLAPTGAAGGDLAGTYPNPTIGAGKVLTTSLASGVGAKKVQEVFATINTVQTTTKTDITTNDDLPQITEGDQLMTLNITPLALTNYLKIRFYGIVANSAGVSTIAALFYDAQANAISAARVNVVANTNVPLILEWQGLVSSLIGALAQIAFQIRWGSNSAGTCTVNGVSGGRLFGGALATYLTIEEYRP